MFKAVSDTLYVCTNITLALSYFNIMLKYTFPSLPFCHLSSEYRKRHLPQLSSHSYQSSNFTGLYMKHLFIPHSALSDHNNVTETSIVVFSLYRWLCCVWTNDVYYFSHSIWSIHTSSPVHISHLCQGSICPVIHTCCKECCRMQLMDNKCYWTSF